MFEKAAMRTARSRAHTRIVPHGFTLIEFAIAVAVIGILATVALVGIAGMAKKNGTCYANAASAASAAALYHRTYNRYPERWSDMTTTIPASYVLGNGVAINPLRPRELDGNGWKLTMGGAGKTIPTFTCS